MHFSSPLRRGKAGAFLLLLGLVGTITVAVPAGSPARASSGETLQQLKQQLQQAEAALQTDKSKLGQLKVSYQKTLQELYIVRDNLRITNSKIAVLKAQISSTDAQRVKTEAEITTTQKALTRDQSTIRDAMRAYQIQGTEGFLAVLLSARSFSDFVSRLGLVKEIMDSNLRVVHNVQVEKAKLVVVDAQLRTEETQLKSLQAQAAQQAQILAGQQVQIQSQMAKLVAEVTQTQKIVNSDQANQQAIEDAIVAVESAGNGQSIGSIHFIWPVHGRITSPFGWRLDPVVHKYWLHSGVDIGVPIGTPIHAAAAGTVILAGWVTGYGNTVVLDHGDGITTLYAHQSKILVKIGEAVTQGEVIGLSGMTGWATGPHVHFEIRIAGKPQNPIPYLPGG